MIEFVPSDFVNKYLGRSIDYDGAYGVQCVDAFRQFCTDVGIPSLPTPNNYASGYWHSRYELGFEQYFEFIPLSASNVLQDGDWVIWDNGSVSHPYSHIAMYFRGQEFGQNQKTSFRGFSLRDTVFTDRLGVLRYRYTMGADSSPNCQQNRGNCKLTRGRLKCMVSAVNVRTAPSTKARIRAQYKKGQTVVIDSIYYNENRFWGHYISSTGVASYVALNALDTVYPYCYYWEQVL